MVAAIAMTAGLVLILGGTPVAPTARSDHPEAIQLVDLPDRTGTTAATPDTPAEPTKDASLAPDHIDEIMGAMVTAPETTTTSIASTPPPTSAAPNTTTTTRPRATTTTTAPAPPPPPSGEFRSDFEAEFLAKINGLRSSRGLAPLAGDGSLNTRARNWSKHMAERNKLSHSNLSSLLPPWSAAGENVGRGGSVDSLFNALVNSPNHLSNMLGDFTHIGIGVWRASNGTLWTTHVFTR
jgi:uncharacterized protein YkwD